MSPGEQRNHGLKYESDCVSIGIGIKIYVLPWEEELIPEY
jgi:hypothetical protein